MVFASERTSRRRNGTSVAPAHGLPPTDLHTEVLFEATLWGTIKELREVIALAESGTLTSIPIERAPLERINDVYARLKRGEVHGRAVITPAA